MNRAQHADDEPPDTVARRLRDALDRVVTARSRAASRLGAARTSVAFATEGESVSLLLGHSPAVASPASGPCEVEIDLGRGQALAFACGRLSIGGALLRGTVVARGPVRRFLEVEPVLRALLAVGADDQDLIESELLLTGLPPAVRPPRPSADLLSIETRGLGGPDGRADASGGADLRVPEGVVSVLLGAAGSGKSRLLGHVSGAIAPETGQVLLRGRALADMSRSELRAIRRDVGVVPQHLPLVDHLTVAENLAAALTQSSDVSALEVPGTVERHLRSLGLTDAAGRRPRELSNWRYVRAAYARATIAEPSLLLLDEPEAGLDPVRTTLLADLLIDHHAEYGGTVLVATRDAPLARAIAGHLTLVDRGAVIACGTPEEVEASDDPTVRALLSMTPEDAPGPRT